MENELRKLVENSRNPEGLAKIFERIAERCREPIEFIDDEPEKEEKSGEATTDGP